jgi:putative ABC transport system permease protein
MGVAVGIGALISMVSFGTGMQKNVTEVFYENDLFTTIYVTSQNINFDQISPENLKTTAGFMAEPAPALNDSSIAQIRSLPGVTMVFPDIRIPVKIRLKNKETKSRVQGLPAAMKKYKPFNNLKYGTFFASDSGNGIIINEDILQKLKIVIRDPATFKGISLEDSIRGFRSIPLDSLLGHEIKLTTSVVDVSNVMKNPLLSFSRSLHAPFKEHTTRMKIIGIQEKTTEFNKSRHLSDCIIPLKTAEKIPRLGFSNVWDLLDRKHKMEGHASVIVRIKNLHYMDQTIDTIENMGYKTLNITNQLSEIKKGFIILDTALGAVGTIALFVAALGIINTMVMSILERTREIGIMKAIGGSETEIKGIFFIEAGTIGLFGGIFGLLLGWIVTRIANVVANYYILKEGSSYVEFFYMPLWLILGGIGFSILVSLIAGLYPAIRAARIDPVEALRHD